MTLFAQKVAKPSSDLNAERQLHFQFHDTDDAVYPVVLHEMPMISPRCRSATPATRRQYVHECTAAQLHSRYWRTRTICSTRKA